LPARSIIETTRTALVICFSWLTAGMPSRGKIWNNGG
jgi:hypothetical protein